MKKNIIYMALLLLTSIGSGTASSLFQDETLLLRGKSITDDVIANSIRNPRPASISDVTNFIDNSIKKGDFRAEDIKVLDLQCNNITHEGATQLFNYISNRLTSIQEIDLSSNRIRDMRGNMEGEAFVAALGNVIKMPTLVKIDLGTNYLGANWNAYVSGLYPELIWKLKI